MRHASVSVPLAPIRVPSQSHLPRVSCWSRLSADDKGDNEMLPEAVHRSPGICLENPSPFDHLDIPLCLKCVLD